MASRAVAITHSKVAMATSIDRVSPVPLVLPPTIHASLACGRRSVRLWVRGAARGRRAPGRPTGAWPCSKFLEILSVIRGSRPIRVSRNCRGNLTRRMHDCLSDQVSRTPVDAGPHENSKLSSRSCLILP